MTRYFKQPIHAYGHMGVESIEGEKAIAHVVLQHWTDPLAADDNRILTTTAMPTAAAGVDVTTFAAQPDYARNLTAVASAACTSVVTVTGEDIRGDALTEELTLNGTDPVVGSKAFSKVTNIHLAQRSPGAANVIVGIGDKLGLYRHPLAFAVEGIKDTTLESTPPTIDVTNHTVDFNNNPTGSADYLLKYWSSDVK